MFMTDYNRTGCVVKAKEMLATSLRSSPFIKHLSCLFLSPFARQNLIPPPLLTNLSPPFYHHPALSQCKRRNGTTICFPKQSHCMREISTMSTFSPPIEDPSMSPYLSVRIRCCRDVADVLSEALLCFGASSASIEELDDCESIDEICISSIFTDGQDVGTCISHAADSIGLMKTPLYEAIMVEQCDWIKNAKESFQPLEVTDGLWIIPEWRTPPDVHAMNIFLNPGLAFGTGEHPTTKLCLLLLHGLIKGGEHFLDYGTGSGILSIAAVKLGAAFSVGVDIDPQAITSACQNAALNNIQHDKMQLHLASPKLTPFSQDGRSYGCAEALNSYSIELMDKREKYDIVIANILLNPLLELAGHVVSYAKPGAVIGISGILSDQ
ncbi:ribosomal protein L11 methyltransferase-like protein isoform X2 [Tasmannia lanceolata]